MKLGSVIALFKLVPGYNKKRKVICILCKSKGRCRCGTVDRWTPQPPRIA
jgi:hypothetical protein